MGAERHCFVVDISWQGISSENLEKGWVRCKMICPNDMHSGARSDQIRPGQVMQSHLDLKIDMQHSACHREVTYQISCQSSHRAQIYRPYINRLRAFNHFRYLHIKTGISKSFELPAILFGTLVMFYPWSVPNIVDFRGGKSIRKCIFLLWPWMVKVIQTC